MRSDWMLPKARALSGSYAASSIAAAGRGLCSTGAMAGVHVLRTEDGHSAHGCHMQKAEQQNLVC